MNAAARVIHQSNLFHGQLADLRMSKHLMYLMVLVTSLLISALAVIYTTNAYRSTFSQTEDAERQTHQLQLQWGQLLLEQASLATPARVQSLAESKLGMKLPNTKNTFILQAK